MNCSMLNTNFSTRQLFQFLPVFDHFRLATVVPNALPTRRVSRLEACIEHDVIHVHEDGMPARQFPMNAPMFDEILHCDHLVMNTVNHIPETAYRPIVTFETRGFNHMLKQFMNRDLEKIIINPCSNSNTDFFNVSFEQLLEQLGPRTRRICVPIKRFRDWKLFVPLLTKWAAAMRKEMDGALEQLKLEFAFVAYADMADFLTYNIAGMEESSFCFSVALHCGAEGNSSETYWLDNALKQQHSLVSCGNPSTSALTIFCNENSTAIIYEKQELKTANRKRRQPSFLHEATPKKIKFD